MAFSFTGDAGCQYGGGSSCKGGNGTQAQNFLGWMFYNRFWFDKDQFALTLGGGSMSNPGRYLVLLPPINGADAVSGSPYLTENPGQPAYQWDMTATFHWMPRDFLTFWWETGYRHSNIPYFAGSGGVTPPGGNNGSPANYVCSSGASAGTGNLAAAEAACGGGAGSLWYPDLRNSQTTVSMGIMVKF
jgi:Putative beta-barrel porin-2, OmpL-like. bbp2